MKFHKIAVGLMAVVLMLAIPPFTRAQAANDDDAEMSESDKADAVVRRHKKEIKKIPHVANVEADETDSGEIVINVEVDKQKNVDEVARKVPSRIEGFAVDVIAEDEEETVSDRAFSSSSDPSSELNRGELKAGENVVSGATNPDAPPRPAASR
ncbi:MAG: hypothetical protein Q7S58_18895 [Candidatus Binatus sp.]|uniref:hypothetical protein n=1 Tax=Candidatus Binatus sp. TaxID=2811406 RepID=UPI002715C95A|nr:hypothetical protein [Candidatus Binatus sp.]MDO8434468.1 hypothetical protein [Candidatus Binatus sp.]